MQLTLALSNFFLKWVLVQVNYIKSCLFSEWAGQHEDSVKCPAMWPKQKWACTERQPYSRRKPSQQARRQTKPRHAITGDVTISLSGLVSMWLLPACRDLTGATVLPFEERPLYYLFSALFISGRQSLRPGEHFVLCGPPCGAARGGSAAPWVLCSVHQMAVWRQHT